MSALTLRLVKGSALTWSELDDNFTNLNNDKYQSGSNPTFGAVTATSYAGIPTFTGPADGLVVAGSNSGTLFLRDDGQWVAAGGGTAADTTFVPAGTIAATNVQDALEELDNETQAALAVLTSGLPTGTVGIGTFLVSGGVVAWQSALIYRAGAANYFISGTAYTSIEQNVTLAVADATLDRIDVLVLDSSGVLSSITGTPAVSPAETVVDPAVYLRLGVVYVQANTLAPSLTQTNIYLENTEWTATASAGTIVVNSTNNPRSGTTDIEGTAVAANQYVSLVKPAAGTTDLATQNSLVFYVRVKSAFPSTKAFRLGWFSGTALRGTQVTVSNGLFGFNSATTGSYQQIVVPISAFNMPTGNLVTTLRFTIIGSGANVGFYLDDIVLVAGATTIPSLTASRALISNISGNVAASAVTATELGYVSGVTSAIQTQLNGALLTYSASAPVSPVPGARWVSSTEGVLYTYVNDGTSTQWVDFSASGSASTSAVWGGIVGTLSDQTDLTSSLVPDQTGNSGKVLTTNGTTASWSSTLAAASGTFTPTLTPSVSGSLTGVTGSAQYTRIGNMMLVAGQASWTGNSSANGGLQIGGMPTAAASCEGSLSLKSNGLQTALDSWLSGQSVSGATYLLVGSQSYAGGITSIGTFDASGTIRFSAVVPI